MVITVVKRVGLILLVLSLGAYAAMGVRVYSGTMSGTSASLSPAGTQFSTNGIVTYLTARPTDFKFASSSNATVEVAVYNYSGFSTPSLEPVNPILRRNFSTSVFFTYAPTHRGYYVIIMTNLSPRPSDVALDVSTQPGAFEPDLFYDLTILSFIGLGLFLGASLLGWKLQEPSGTKVVTSTPASD